MAGATPNYASTNTGADDRELPQTLTRLELHIVSPPLHSVTLLRALEINSPPRRGSSLQGVVLMNRLKLLDAAVQQARKRWPMTVETLLDFHELALANLPSRATPGGAPLHQASIAETHFD